MISVRRDEVEATLKALWLQVETGDEETYRVALSHVANLMRAYLRRRMAGRIDDVEDVVQESLLALHLRRGSYDSSQPITAWIYAITRHKLIDYWRRNKLYYQTHEFTDEILDSLAVAEDMTASSRIDLQTLLQGLPQAQRVAIELTKIQGLSVIEASKSAGVSEGAIRVQVHRGLKRLSDLVKGQFHEA